MIEPRAVVIGVGNDYRRDDGIGPAVARRLESLRIPAVAVARWDGDPAGLLDLWADVELAVVVDAVRCDPSNPGRIWRTTVEALRGCARATGSHALGIPDVLPLGRVLGSVPAELVVVAVEAQSLDLGVGMSGPVAAAVPDVVAVVLSELARLGLRPSEPALPE
ncbi:hydrogenase maturation protease [Nocardia aobensis]|uniref:hydrogenase maturation protease n=1 Tax=Nocardia aobensis TaxID=257277 RepID=UPI0002EBA16A|nr:hydrogenase maturation protease [Nocardia aobensis]